MKKFLAVFLFSCCLATLLATQAAARDEAYVVGSFYGIYREGLSTFKFFDYNLTEERKALTIATTNGSVYLDLTFSFPSENRHTTYFTTIFLTLYNMANSNEIYPTQLIVNRGLDSAETIDIYGAEAMFDVNYAVFDVSVQRSPVTSTTDSFTKILGIDLELSPWGSYSDGLQSLSFVFDIADFQTNSNSFVYGHGPITIEFVNEELNSVLEAINRTSNNVQSGFKGTATALAANSAAISASLNEQTQSMTATLDQVKEAVDQMKDGQKDALKGALDEFYEELKQEAQDTANATVEEIKEKFDIDISAYSNSMNALYNSVSTHSMDANMTFPAGKVSLMGQEMVFWQEAEIDFNSVFENEYVQLLLIPLRFVIFFGFGAYLLNWIKKLENMITMNSTEG